MRRSAVAACLALAALPAAANPLETIDVLCGGITSEEREHLRREVVAASVSLEFLVATDRRHVADVDVLFTPISAATTAFGIVTHGHVCYLELPPGEYRIDAWFNGHSRSMRATVPPAAGDPMRLALEFPEEPGKDALLVPITASVPQK